MQNKPFSKKRVYVWEGGPLYPMCVDDMKSKIEEEQDGD